MIVRTNKIVLERNEAGVIEVKVYAFKQSTEEYTTVNGNERTESVYDWEALVYSTSINDGAVKELFESIANQVDTVKNDNKL